jgi:hypothetical protein
MVRVTPKLLEKLNLSYLPLIPQFLDGLVVELMRIFEDAILGGDKLPSPSRQNCVSTVDSRHQTFSSI